MTEPTDAELEALAIEHEAFGFGLADKQGLSTHGFDPDGLRSFARAVLARWGTPPAVADEPWGACIGGRAWVGKLLPDIALRMAEAEGKPIQWLYTTPQPTQAQDEALIRQMLEALEQSNATLWEEDDDPTRPAHEAITAARTRLGEGNGL